MAYQDVGFVCLDELLVQHAADVALVVTHADDPNEEIWFRSVAERARAAGLPVLVPRSVNDPAVVRLLTAMDPDFIFSFYFREILAPRVLGLARRGALNLHGSFLPRYRGRSPVNWVLVNGERETGVTLHYMDEKPDHGDIVAQRAVPITDDDTALTLTRKMGEAARLLLRDALPALLAGTASRTPQDHSRASYFGGRRPADGLIAWNRAAREIYNLVRAVTHPFPGAFTNVRGRRVLVWWAEPMTTERRGAAGEVLEVRPGEGVLVHAGEGALLLRDVEVEGDGEQRADRLAERLSLRPGDRLGTEG